MEIVESILTANPCYKAGKKINVKGLMLHSVGCPQPSAEVFIKKWNNADESRACVHAFIDGNTAKVYQTLPWDHRAWHCGSGENGSANNTHIGVEMCEPACIRYTGGSTFTCSDNETAMKVVRRTYDAAVELFAYLCKKYGLNPLEDGVIISHKEGHDRGLASGHGDPDHLWKGMGCEYTMDGFRKAVAAAMQGQTADKPADKPADEPVAKQAAEPVQKEAPAAQSGEMTISDAGVALIAKYEGCRLEAYKCPAGVWTIGYGHTAGVNQGDRLSSEAEAKALLKEDLKKYGNCVNDCVKNGLITFSLNQNQFDALTSFCYNCGQGNLKKLVTNRDEQTIAEKLLQYVKGGGKVLPGLVKRREEEKDLFLKRG
jgi:GH24 family phage-related lysozyme (muramidase)